MSFILTLTDFSATNAHAVNYACMLAAAQNLPVTILHNFTIPIIFNESTPIPVIGIEDGQKVAEDRMVNYLQTLRAEHPGIHITTHIVYGTVLDALSEYTGKPEKPWLTVIVNDHENADSLFDDNVVDAMKELACPVLAIPENGIYNPVKNLCLACDIKQFSPAFPAQEIIAMVKTLGATLHILNIGTGTDKTQPEATSELQTAFASLNPVYHFSDNDNVDNAIHEFLTANNIDLLAIVPHRHPFFEGLFHKSHTKAITRMVHIPIISFHEQSN